MMKEFWDNRYAQAEYAYGKTPNEFLESVLPQLDAGKALFPAEGEGRNAVFAAQLGWNVSAFDISIKGKEKALKLAVENKVTIDYTIAGFNNVNYPLKSFDLICFVFVHMPKEIMLSTYHSLLKYLNTGGYVIFEGYGDGHQECQQQNPSAGGPTDPSMLFDKNDIKTIFSDFNVLEFSEDHRILSEGKFHVGKSFTVRFFGQKK